MRWIIGLGVILSGCVVVKAPSGMGWREGIVTLHAAEAEYHFDKDRFATSLLELGPSGANMIDRDLASGEKGGFRYTLSPTPAGYTILATPVHSDAQSRSYFSDQSMRIHVHTGPEPATVNDPLQGDIGPPQESDPVAPPQRDKTNSQATAGL